jgi:type IV pilus assembly protein PilE
MIFTRKHTQSGFVDAFSLAEILIVLAIMGILIMLVVPNQAGVATRSKSLEAQAELKALHTMQYGYYLQYSKYSSNETEIGYIPHKLITEGGNALYKVSIQEASPTGYKAVATAVQDFDGDGQMNTWEIDQEGIPKEILPD